MSENYTFDLTPIQVEYKIGGIDYLLREASGEAAVKFSNAKLANLTLNDGKVIKVVGMANIQPLLISLCLIEKATGKPVEEALIKSWPSRIQTALFDKAKEISEIDQDATKEGLEKIIADAQKQLAEIKAKENPAKNEQSGTQDGSD